MAKVEKEKQEKLCGTISFDGDQLARILFDHLKEKGLIPSDANGATFDNDANNIYTLDYILPY